MMEMMADRCIAIWAVQGAFSSTFSAWLNIVELFQVGSGREVFRLKSSKGNVES